MKNWGMILGEFGQQKTTTIAHCRYHDFALFSYQIWPWDYSLPVFTVSPFTSSALVALPVAHIIR
jgi:hypothetical protein